MAQRKPYSIKITLESSSPREDGTHVVDAYEVIAEGAEGIDEFQVKFNVISNALDEAKRGVRADISSLIFSNETNKPLDWKQIGKALGVVAD